MEASVRHAGQLASDGPNCRSDDLNRASVTSEQLFKQRVAGILKSLGAKGSEHKRLAAKLGLSDRALDYLAEEDRAPGGDTRARLAVLLRDEGRLDDAFAVLRVDFLVTIHAMADELYRAKLRDLLAEPASKLNVIDGGRR